MSAQIKTTYETISVILLGSYLLAQELTKYIHISWVVHALGFILLLCWLPYSLLKLANIHLSSFLELFLAQLAVYFSLVVPVYYLLNLCGLTITTPHTFILLLLVLAIQYIKFPQRKSYLINLNKIVIWAKGHWPLLVTLVLFIGTHVINFHFYKFIPEGDGYLDMSQINQTISSGIVSVSYRYFFNTAMSIIGSFAKLTPYAIFSVWMVGLQATLIIAIYLMLKKYKVDSKALQLLILIATLSVPVINMEIDYVRPQTVMVILLPIYIYFLWLALKEKNKIGWVIATLIALAGIGYHQFFLILLGGHIVISLWIFYHQKYKQYDRPGKTIAGLSVLIALLLVYIVYENFLADNGIISSTQYYALSILSYLRFSNWQWWFLNDYPLRNDPTMGWQGVTGAIDFYAYYASPLVVVNGLLLIWYTIKKSALRHDVLICLSLPFLTVFLFFAEILPRFNRPLIPERFWLLIDIFLLFLLIPLCKQLPRQPLLKKAIISVVAFAMLAGIGGSFYIASGKQQTIISYNDLAATNWIQTQSPSNATFITQTANDALFSYYFKRSAITNLPIEDWATTNVIQYEKNQLAQTGQNQIASFACSSSLSLGDIKKCVSNLYTYKNAVLLQAKALAKIQAIVDKPLYIYYSENRFSNIFAQRPWWQTENYAGLDKSKLDSLYQRVYDHDGVFIWKVS